MTKVACIVGTGHCGSTLLDLLLGSHSGVFSLGEFRTIGRALRSDDPEICVICGKQCPFWSETVSLPLLRLFYANDSRFKSVRSRVARLFYNPYRLMFRWSGKQVLIDSSKNLNWFNKQFRPSYASHGIDRYLIWVFRDGRAVVNSYYRKYPERGVREITESWCRNVERISREFEDFPGPRLKVTYEQLTQCPDRVLNAVCKFLDLEYEPRMLSYWEHDHHHLFGNAGTNRLIVQYQHDLARAVSDEDWMSKHGDYFDHDYYDSQGFLIKYDERWREEFSEEAQGVFEGIAGPLNRRLMLDA